MSTREAGENPTTGAEPARSADDLPAGHGRDRLIIAFLASTGLRSGELRQLRAIDVDLDNAWVHVVSRENLRTKTGKSRKFPLQAELARLLSQFDRPTEGWFFRAEPRRKYPVGDHWFKVKKLNDRLVRQLEKLGLPSGRENNGYTIHSLRHFLETHAINAGVPPACVPVFDRVWLISGWDTRATNRWERFITISATKTRKGSC